MSRREELIVQATDYVLAAGLIGLSLRPLAAALGTSDRMLNYHFGSKAGLVAAILRESTDRSAAQIGALPPARTPQQAVIDLWRVLSADDQQRCQRMYVEAAALGLFGSEPYATVVAEANTVWYEALRAYVLASGVPVRRATRVANLVDATFMGLQLDEALSDAESDTQRAIEDLAAAVGFLANR